MKKLTTTSYAFLGLLALHPWSTYEVTQQVRKSLRQWWPRTERQLYEQPKLLADHGLAKAVTEHVGRRPRTMYSITPAGRRALRAWLGEPAEPCRFEWEAILRVFFAEHGTKQQLLAMLESSAEQYRRTAQDMLAASEEVFDPEYRYADRVHVFALIAKLEVDMWRTISDWLTWAGDEVAGWPDVAGPREPLALLESVFADLPEAMRPRSRAEKA